MSKPHGPRPVVVKWGGSVLTTKRGGARVRSAVLRRLARELRGVPNVLLVHGGGSFGHSVAAAHGLRGEDAGTGPAAGRVRLGRGAARVQASMRELNRRVLVALGDEGVPAVAVPGGEVSRLRNGALRALDARPFEGALARGLAPVTYGDAAPDAARGWAIVSGDALALALARRFRARAVVFVTDRDGLYSAPPGAPGARLERRLTARGLDALGDAATGGPPSGADVTGGMGGKVRAVRRIAALGVPVHIVNGRVAGRLRAALRGGDPIGTRVTPDRSRAR